MTGKDMVGGLQFEIVPAIPLYKDGLPRDTLLIVETLLGKKIEIMAHLLMTVEMVKRMIETKEGLPTDHQRLIFEGKQLEDSKSIPTFKVKPSDCC